MTAACFRPAITAAKKVAIVQSNYIPWKGYFDLMNMVDEFILYDDAQYTRRDWRNRNRIKTPAGLQWLTIPVLIKGRFLQKINETRVSDSSWGARHWSALVHNYSRAPYFKHYAPLFQPLYRGDGPDHLSQINFRFIEAVRQCLGIRTKISWSTDYPPGNPRAERNERLLELCRKAGAGHYYSGPAAKDYIDPKAFRESGVQLSYCDYSGYPEYAQLFGRYEHSVSVLDLIFNTGPMAAQYMLSFGR